MTPVSELLAVKIELAILKFQQAQAVQQELVSAAQALIEQARQEVGAPIGHLYYPETKTFGPPAATGPMPLSTTPARQAKRAAAGKA